MSKIRVLLVDDHQLIIDGLRGFLEKCDNYQIVGEAHSGDEAIKLTPILNPDVILMDIEMQEISGIQACEEIKRNHPEIKVIIVSMHHEKELIKKLVDKGADGYLLKNSSQSEVLNAIESVLKGENYFSQDVCRSLLDKPTHPTAKNTGSSDLLVIANLTDREIEILKLVAEGLTNKEIGDSLYISHRTVDTHRTNIMKKLDINNVASLIRFAFKNRLVQ
ncbi:MAG: response regulator transcription factor [Crocinitomicaceae bacterium]